MIQILLFTFLLNPDASAIGTAGGIFTESSTGYIFFEPERTRPFLLAGYGVSHLSDSGKNEHKVFAWGGTSFDSVYAFKAGANIYSTRKDEFLFLIGRNLGSIGFFSGIEGYSKVGFKAGVQSRIHYIGETDLSLSFGGIGSNSYLQTGILIGISEKLSPFYPRFGSSALIELKKNPVYIISGGVETWFFRRFALRLGGNIKNNKVSVSIGAGYRTLFTEYTDFTIDYALLGNERTIIHTLSIKVFPGDALKKEKIREKKRKEKEKLAQMFKELNQKEKELTELKQKLDKQQRVLLEERGKLLSEKERLEETRKEIEQLRRNAMETLKKIEGLKIEERKEFIKITASEKAVHFELGATGLTVNSIKTLKAIANFLKTYPRYNVRVEGHTDNIPIGPLLKDKYKDNMELSTARAKTVVSYFTEIEGIPEILFSYKGYGETKPVSSNDTEEGRSKNRRVEIYIQKPNE